MPGRVENDPPGRIGPIGTGWTIELDAMPHSATAGSGSTGVASFTADADFDSHLAMNNSSTFIYEDDTVFEVPEVSVGGVIGGITSGYGSGAYGTGQYNTNGTVISDSGVVQVFEPPGALSLTASIDGRIDSVSLQGRTASYTQGTDFTRFATSDVDIPAVTSGSALAAFNLAWQLSGMNPCSYSRKSGVYWSLRGHDVAFNRDGKPLTPEDNSTYKLMPDGKTVFRRWKVSNSFTSTGWDVADGEFWSTSGVGSSVANEAGKRSALVGTTNLNGRSFVLQFGASASEEFLGFGPDDARNGSGKWFTISLHGPTSSATISGQYRSGGGYVTVSKAISLSGIDTTAPVQFVVDIGYPSPTLFGLTVYIQNVDSTDSPVVLTTGLLNTALDPYAAPWKTAGYLHGLYFAIGNYGTFDPSTLLGGYEDWSAQPLCDLDRYGIDTPILPYTGSLWDYLTQVCVARQVGLRLASGRFLMAAMGDDGLRAQVWHPAVSPTFSIDDSAVAASVEVDAQFTSFGPAPRIYDALDKKESYSVTPGNTAEFSITSTSINGLVYNPEPVYAVDDFLHGNHPYGAYIVTASDNQPILVEEWVSYGGSVSVRQSGANTLTLTVVAPNIPLGVDVTGDYSLAVSDGSNSYPMLRLVSVAGGAVVDHKVVFQTGASYTASSNSSPQTVTNVAATNHQALQNTATWAVSEASGPTLVLTGEFPLRDLRQWESSDLGMIPGSTLLYRNLQWRILTSAISNISVQFTAAPFMTYQGEYFEKNWAGFTVDDFAQFWDGKTYDDMATMALAGPNYDWDNTGAVARFSLYPGGGTFGGDPGLETDPALLPDPTLLPDAPGGIGKSGVVFPDNSNLFPGSEEDPS